MTKALINIDDELWTRARLYNVRNGLTVNQLITKALWQFLDREALGLTRPDPFRYVAQEDVDDGYVTPDKNTVVLKDNAPGFGRSLPAPKPTRKK